MLVPKLTWIDPTRLVYDHIEVYVTVGTGLDPVDPGDKLVDVAIGIEQYVDPNTYGFGTQLCYALKAVTPSGAKSGFTNVICIQLGIITPQIGVLNPPQIVTTAYAAVIGDAPGAFVGFYTSAAAVAHPALMTPGSLPFGPPAAAATATPYAATMAAQQIGFVPGVAAAVIITASEPTVSTQAGAMIAGKYTAQIIAYNASVAGGATPDTFVAGTTSATFSKFGGTVARQPAGLSPGTTTASMTAYAATASSAGAPAAADVDITGTADVDITGQPDIDASQ